MIIRLMNIAYFAYHGINKEEHTLGNKYEVDIECKIAFDGTKEDVIDSTIDYGQLSQAIGEYFHKEKKKYLIETIAFLISKKILQKFSTLEEVRVKVRKRNPPIGQVCDYAEAECYLNKSNL